MLSLLFLLILKIMNPLSFVISTIQVSKGTKIRNQKPIRSTVFNYNKLETELDIENSIPDS